MTTCPNCHRQIILTAYGQVDYSVPHIKLSRDGYVWFDTNECRDAYAKKLSR